MSFLVTARKWRPMIFEEIVGQDHIATTLRNAIASKRISHAYLFSGARGCGKTTTARILARAVNCLHPKNYNPDNTCELCKEILEGRSMTVFEIDGASNRGIEEIRNLREALRYGPPKGSYKIYIIDEVHMLTKEAFNALLKTLEEPPPYVMFIFATTEIQKVPLTILSRCQRFDFRRITVEEIMKRLRHIAKEEGISIEDDALLLIAKRADGSMRDAQSMFDQVVSFCGSKIATKQIVEMWNIVDEEIYFRATALMKERDIKGGLTFVDEITRAGFDNREFMSGLLEHLRNILVARVTGATKLIETSEVYKKRYMEDAKAFSENDILRLIQVASATAASLRWSQQPRLTLEIGIVQMISMDSSVQITQLLGDIESLKKKLDGRRPADAPVRFSPSIETPAHAAARPAVKIAAPPKPSERLEPAASEPDQMYAGLPPAASTGVKVAAKESPVVENPATPLTQDEARFRWTSLIDEARKQRIDLWAMLNETTLIDVQADRLRIGCPDDFHMDALKRNRQFLSDLAQRVYGAKYILETMLAKEIPAQTGRHEPSSPSGGQPAAPNGDLWQHPVVQALRKEFGAVEVK